jgi:hypothetical protein
MGLYLILLLSFFQITTWAAPDESRLWAGFFIKKNLQPLQTSFWGEVQYRYNFESGGMQQLLTRFGVLKSLAPGHEVGALMGLIQTGIQVEYRPTLQHIYHFDHDQHKFLFRSRLEWRDLENNPKNSMRYRLMNSYRYQLNPVYSVLLWDEPFINLTREDWSGERTIERNRLFAGIRMDFAEYRLELGYLNQFIPRKNHDTSEHVLVGYIFF